MTLQTLARRLRRFFIPGAADADDEFYRVSFAQEGEDLLLLSLFEGQDAGFYVDVGAHHPRKYSNTFALYSRGWHGINIDATPGSMTLFRAARPRDVNLELAISDARRLLTFYEFNEPALNGFESEVTRTRNGFVAAGQPSSAAFRVIKEHQLQTVTLGEVLDAHVPPSGEIDVLTVDVEGADYAVLASNNWAKYRPSLVLVEDAGVHSLDELKDSNVAQLLRDQGYLPICKTRLTLFFARQDRLSHDILGPRIERAMAGAAASGAHTGVRPAT